MTTDATVDLVFPITGRSPDGGALAIPADHGYALYSALCRVLPELHADTRVGIHPLSGRLVGGRMLDLTERGSLRLRLPAEAVPPLISLAGQSLEIHGARLQVGTPSVHALRACDRLSSRMVVIKGMMDADSFLKSARAQLAELEVTGELTIARRHLARPIEGRTGARDEWLRRTLRVKDRTIVGYAVEVTGLAPADSLTLQAKGIGGRRRFGCGLFVPMRAPA